MFAKCVGISEKWSAFDPSGLERAAKAVRELDASREWQCVVYMYRDNGVYIVPIVQCDDHLF